MQYLRALGLLGIAIALLGAKLVVLTDQPNMMEILRKNVVLNVKTRNAKVKQLNWYVIIVLVALGINGF